VVATKTQKKRKAKKTHVSSALKALNAAAMVLPGMVVPVQAAEDEFSLVFSHYEESERDLSSVYTHAPLVGFIPENSNAEMPSYRPIEVDGLHLKAKVSLFDRLTFTGNYTEDTWSGATPIATAPMGARGNRVVSSNSVITGASPILQSDLSYFDAELNPINKTGPLNASSYDLDPVLVHTMVMASPETRKQGDFNLAYEFDNASINVGGGISVENDYESRFVNWGGQIDFNNKLTTLSFNQSYTNSTTSAVFDHDAFGYIQTYGYRDQIVNTQSDVLGDTNTIYGDREDWSTGLGFTQVLGKNTLFEASVNYTNSSGFMENPYKAVYVFYLNPAEVVPGVFGAAKGAYLEERPDKRNQWAWNAKLVQYIKPLDAAVNLSYRFFHDDWGINAHTIEADWIQPLGLGWTVTPTVRYYSQDKADFYHPYLVSTKQITNNQAVDYGNIPEQDFSSDHRLSGYGALSGGVVISKQFSKGVRLDMGFEYYTHEGSLKLGSGGEGDYADFSSYTANAALTVDLSTMANGSSSQNHSHHMEHGTPAPAGVMSAHMLSNAGDWMMGYKYVYSTQAGDMLHGNDKVADQAILDYDCGGRQCYVAPKDMTMHMHMFNLMYAPTDWLNLMVMPTFVDMSMNMRMLDGAPAVGGTGAPEFAELSHASHEHMTGGFGDTQLAMLFKLYDSDVHHLHLGTGFSAPTGNVKIELRRAHTEDLGLIHYGMQIGSGTWDFLPSLTYTGQSEKWSWGAQARGVVRLESQNDVGYREGDLFQSSVWGSFNLMKWLSVSVRGVYTSKGALHGEYNTEHQPIGPMDSPDSYGGEYYDLGFGLNAMVPTGNLAGNSLSVEWLQPMEDDVNGYQLERDGALSVNWGYAF